MWRITWTDEEKDAAEDLWNLWGFEWKRHVEEYPALGRRSIEAVAAYIKNNLRTADIPLNAPIERSAWPEPGVLVNGRFVGKRLFEIDQDAVLNHGSPLSELRRPVIHSASGCSARWASGAA